MKYSVRIALKIAVILICVFTTSVAQINSSRTTTAFDLILSIDSSSTIKCGLPVLAQQWESDRSFLLDLTRPVLQKTRMVGGFRVHYDTVGANVPAMLNVNKQRIPGSHEEYIDSVLAIMQTVVATETIILGYTAAPQDGIEGGGPEYDIYVEELSNLYGVTIPENQLDTKPDGGRFTSYLEIDNDFIFVFPFANKGLPAMRVTLAHEYHHAIQLGSYGFWSRDRYFYEVTSTWMEDVLFTEVNDYLQYLPSHFLNPQRAFTTSDGATEYARCIWGHYLEKRFSPAVMRMSWEEMRNVPSLEAMDNALRSPPFFSTFRSAFTEWSEWNYYTGSRADSVRYYPESPLYPPVNQTIVSITSSTGQSTGSLPAMASRYFDIRSSTETVNLILSNINFESAVLNNTTAFPYTYRFSNSKLGSDYRQAGTSLFVKLDVPDISNWYTSGLSMFFPEGVAFPNPFITSGKGVVNIPINSAISVAYSLSVFSSDMDRTFDFTGSSHYVTPPGTQAAQWDGTTERGERASSGVYMYVLEYGGEIHKGKIVLIQQ